MGKADFSDKKVLITGGTSGLGYEIAKLLAAKGCNVVVTGRNFTKKTIDDNRLKFYPVDFRYLAKVAQFGEMITEEQGPFSLILCNAGILSPPEFILTPDGNECTFQVNFLAHLLLTLILVSKKPVTAPMRIVPVVSPVYRIGKIKNVYNQDQDHYSRISAYSGSKLYMALLSRFLDSRFSNEGITSFCFDPGVFSSGIYRTQHHWFQNLYRIASPVLKNPAIVAAAAIDLIDKENPAKGVIYNRKGKINQIPEIDPVEETSFWNFCTEKIRLFTK